MIVLRDRAHVAELEGRGHRRLQHSCGDCRSKHRRCGSRAIMMPSLRLPTPRPCRRSSRLLVILALDRAVSPQFFDLRMQDGRLFGSLIDVLNRGAPVALLALGMTLVIATRGIDLSVGAVMAICRRDRREPCRRGHRPAAGAGRGARRRAAVRAVERLSRRRARYPADHRHADPDGRRPRHRAADHRGPRSSPSPRPTWSGSAAARVLGLPMPVVIVARHADRHGCGGRAASALGLLIEAIGVNARASALAGHRHARA